VDPLVQPVSVDVRMGSAILEAIDGVMKRFPGVGTICGLSNISYGLPARRLINRHFLGLAVSRGLSAAILDPTDAELMSALAAANMLLGKDEYCAEYIEAFERGLFAATA
jgi:5-methyltetrahydrofolate--homocysteine methyltransferase